MGSIIGLLDGLIGLKFVTITAVSRVFGIMASLSFTPAGRASYDKGNRQETTVRTARENLAYMDVSGTWFFVDAKVVVIDVPADMIPSTHSGTFFNVNGALDISRKMNG